MKKFFAGGALIIILGIAITLLVYRSHAREEQQHYDREETQFFVTNLAGANLSLFEAGVNLEGAVAMPEFKPEGMWLSRGNYFLKVDQAGRTSFAPVPIVG